MPTCVVKRLNQLGKGSDKKEHKSKLVFLDCLKCYYNWENEELNDMEGVV